jgi:hypothetical protein
MHKKKQVHRKVPYVGVNLCTNSLVTQDDDFDIVMAWACASAECALHVVTERVSMKGFWRAPRFAVISYIFTSSSTTSSVDRYFAVGSYAVVLAPVLPSTPCARSDLCA